MAMKIPPGKGKPPVKHKHFILIKYTEQGSRQKAAARSAAQKGVGRTVEKEKGRCRLYATRGGAFDYVSIIDDLSPASAVKLIEEIEKNGTVKAMVLTGIEIFEGR